MPEGPETQRQVDFLLSLFKFGLEEYVLGDLEIFGDRFEVDKDLLLKSIGESLKAIYCKGKTYFIELGGGLTVVAHHGMDGWWSVKKEKHSQAMFTFLRVVAGQPVEDDAVIFYYTNVRLGNFEVHEHRAAMLLRDELASGFIGKFVLEQAEFVINFSEFSDRKRLRDTLFDQHKICSGLGNYLIAEIMYDMKLHPLATLGDLDTQTRMELYHVCKKHVQGHYDSSLKMSVYDCQQDPFGNPVKKLKVGGRVAHWVPTIQTRGEH